MVRESFTADELERLRGLVGGSEPFACPRCGRTLDTRRVAPRTDVAYVRDRLWMTCGSCEATGVIDLPRETPDRGTR